MTSPARTSPGRGHHSIGSNLGTIMLAIALVGAGSAYGLQSYLKQVRAAARAEDATVTRTLVGTSLRIPASWLRDDGQPGSGFSSQIALRLELPLARDGGPSVIDVTLLPRSRVRPSSLLLDGVYLHQFQPRELSGPPGLVGKPLVGNDGYDGETVWYDPLSADPFVAKCMAPVDPSAASHCLRTVYLSAGIAAVYDFELDVLWSWDRFDGQMKLALSQIGL